MTCPECGAHTQSSAAFCTACGADLSAERRPREPISAGSWKPASTVAPGVTTEPIRKERGPASSGSASVRPSPRRAAHPPTLVREMVGSERTEWIDQVWGAAATVER